MDTDFDLYDILGVAPSSSDEDIRAAYRRAARRFHPDANSHKGAANQFRDIASAYETLSDASSRSRYDTAHNGNSDEAPYFPLKVTPSRRVLPLLDESQVLYLLVELVPDRTRTKQEAISHLNLTLILDRSTSMSGVRLERTKAAARQIIDQLSENDILSVVAFSDRAEVLVPATALSDKATAKAMIMTMQANGGTEIFQGLEAGYNENQRYRDKKYVNHIILLTDGRTYGDEDACLELADKAARKGIGISAMGLGDEWNDAFLDQLAGRTGGNSEYISTPHAVTRFLNDRVRSLGRTLAERVAVSLAPDSDIVVESAFRLLPSPQAVSADIDPVQIGQPLASSNASSIFQLQVQPSTEEGFPSLIRIDVTADIMRHQRHDYKVVADRCMQFAQERPAEEAPLAILDALSKLTLYRMQEKAQEAMARGDVKEATKRLENLATRLLNAGQENLANAAMAEAKRVTETNMLSDEGGKALKYGTRLLLAAPKDA